MKKTALITGASRGIGQAIALRFAQQGYHLALCCRNAREEFVRFCQDLHQQYHVEVLCYYGDVGDHSFISSMAEEVLTAFGQIDVLINNAGAAHIGLLTDLSIDEWNRILSVNLTSVFSTCKCIVPSMVSRKQGKIINISSVWGNTGASCEVAYSASKGGMNAFTKALGKELAPSGIQVNAIACGIIDTSMNACFSEEELSELTEEIPAGRIGTPEEVAALALALAEGHAYLTGQILTLDGGWT